MAALVSSFLLPLWIKLPLRSSAYHLLHIVVCVSVWSHVDVLRAVTKTSLAVDEGPAFGPGDRLMDAFYTSVPPRLHPSHDTDTDRYSLLSHCDKPTFYTPFYGPAQCQLLAENLTCFQALHTNSNPFPLHNSFNKTFWSLFTNSFKKLEAVIERWLLFFWLQMLLCAVYAISKVAGKEIQFKQIVSSYKGLPFACAQVSYVLWPAFVFFNLLFVHLFHCIQM